MTVEVEELRRAAEGCLRVREAMADSRRPEQADLIATYDFERLCSPEFVLSLLSALEGRGGDRGSSSADPAASVAESDLTASATPCQSEWSPDNDPLHLAESCEDPRLRGAGYIVCGSGGDREWHWRPPGGPWHDGHRSEEAAARAALRHLASVKLLPTGTEPKAEGRSGISPKQEAEHG